MASSQKKNGAASSAKKSSDTSAKKKSDNGGSTTTKKSSDTSSTTTKKSAVGEDTKKTSPPTAPKVIQPKAIQLTAPKSSSSSIHTGKFYCTCSNGSIYKDQSAHEKSEKHKRESNATSFLLQVDDNLDEAKKGQLVEFFSQSPTLKYDNYLLDTCNKKLFKLIVSEKVFLDFHKTLKRKE